MNFIINNLIPPHFAMKFDLHEKLKKLVELWRWKINFRRNVFNDNKVQVLSTFYDMKALHFFHSVWEEIIEKYRQGMVNFIKEMNFSCVNQQNVFTLESFINRFMSSKLVKC